MTVEFITALFQLRAEAEATNQPFLAHLIGLAIIEANKVMGETSRADRVHSIGSRQ